MNVTIERTECMTFPRSGHGVLQKVLHRYFEGALVYCESYADPERTLDRDPATNFQKNHDLALDTPVRDDRRYLVQVRYPVDSLVSWFKLVAARGETGDTPAAWTMFAIERASFWMRFYRKWVLDHVPDRLVVDYADLVERPVETVAEVVAFMAGGEPDLDRVRASCAAEAIARRNYNTAFRFYGPAFFAVLEGLFAAVPGVDVAHQCLVIARGDAPPDAVGPAVTELRRAAARIASVADRLGAAHRAAAGRDLMLAAASA